MKRPLAILLTILLLGGCAAAGEDSSSSSALLTGETVSGIITKVNGNEITLDLVTLAQTSSRGEEKASKAPQSSQEGSSPDDPRQGERPSGGSLEGRGERKGSGTGQGGEFSRGETPQGSGSLPSGDPPLGELPGDSPSFEGTAGGSQQKNYTRTGETALYQIPVGASVLTLTGTSREFNSLSTDLLVTITFREDGVTPGQVQVIQSLS